MYCSRKNFNMLVKCCMNKILYEIYYSFCVDINFPEKFLFGFNWYCILLDVVTK